MRDLSSRYRMDTMTALSPDIEAPQSPLSGLEPARLASWRTWLGPAISLAIVVAIGMQFDRARIVHTLQLMPHSVGFWALFLLAYATIPLSEFVIFRRLWAIPFDGFVALTRKMISNEILVGYLGEVQFYGWARTRTDLPNAPFGAIKDVAILSAMAGNLVTILMVVPAWPLLSGLNLSVGGRAFAISALLVMVPSVGMMIFRRRVFSLEPRDLRFVMVVHLARIIGKIALTAVLWHLVLPGMPLAYWFLLSTLRQLLSRLPLVPNKDVLFVGVAVFLIGHDAQIADMLAMLATATLATHLALGAILAAEDLTRAWGRSGARAA